MAAEAQFTTTGEHDLHVVALSRSEAVGVIALLTAQLGGVPLEGNHAGAAPTVNVVDSNGTILYRLAICLERTP